MTSILPFLPPKISDFALTQNESDHDEFTAELSWEASPAIVDDNWTFVSYRSAISIVKPDGKETPIGSWENSVIGREQTSFKKTFKASELGFQENDAVRGYVRVAVGNEALNKVCRSQSASVASKAWIKIPYDIVAKEHGMGDRGQYPSCGELSISWKYDGAEVPDFWDIRHYPGNSSPEEKETARFRLAGAHAKKEGNAFSWRSPTCLFRAPSDYGDTDEQSKLKVNAIFGKNEGESGISPNFSVSSVNWRRPQGCDPKDGPSKCYLPCKEMCIDAYANNTAQCANQGGACTFTGNCPGGQDQVMWCGRNNAGVDFGACCKVRATPTPIPPAPKKPGTGRPGAPGGTGGLGRRTYPRLPGDEGPVIKADIPKGGKSISGTITTTQDTEYANLMVLSPDIRNLAYDFYFAEPVGDSKTQYRYSIDGIADANYIVVAYAGRTVTEVPGLNTESSCTGGAFTLPGDEASRRNLYYAVIPVIKQLAHDANLPNSDEIDNLDMDTLDRYVQTYLGRLCRVTAGNANQNYTIQDFPAGPVQRAGDGVLEGSVEIVDGQTVHDVYVAIGNPFLPQNAGEANPYLILAPTSRRDGKYYYRVGGLKEGEHIVTAFARKSARVIEPPTFNRPSSCQSGNLQTFLDRYQYDPMDIANKWITYLVDQSPIPLQKDLIEYAVYDAVENVRTSLCLTRASGTQNFQISPVSVPPVLTGSGVLSGTVTVQEPSEEVVVLIGNPSVSGSAPPYLFAVNATRDTDNANQFHYELRGLRESQNHIVTALARRSSDQYPYISDPGDCQGNNVGSYLRSQGIDIRQLATLLTPYLQVLAQSGYDVTNVVKGVLEANAPDRLCLVPVNANSTKDFNVYYTARPGLPPPQPVPPATTSSGTGGSTTTAPTISGVIELRNPNLIALRNVDVCVYRSQSDVGPCQAHFDVVRAAFEGQRSIDIPFTINSWLDGSAFSTNQQVYIFAALESQDDQFFVTDPQVGDELRTMTVGIRQRFTLDLSFVNPAGGTTGNGTTNTTSGGPEFSGELNLLNPGVATPGQHSLTSVFLCLESASDKVPGDCDLTHYFDRYTWNGSNNAFMTFAISGWSDGPFATGEQIRVMSNAVLVGSSRSYHLKDKHNASNYTVMTAGAGRALTLEIPITGSTSTGNSTTNTTNGTANTTTNTTVPGGFALTSRISTSAVPSGYPTVVILDANTRSVVTGGARSVTSVNPQTFDYSIQSIPRGTYYVVAFVPNEKAYTFELRTRLGNVPVRGNAPAINDARASACSNREPVTFSVAELLALMPGLPRPDLRGLDPNIIFITQELCKYDIQGDITITSVINW